MNDNIEIIRNRIKNKRSSTVNDQITNYNISKPKSTNSSHLKYFKNLLTRILIAAIFLLLSIIFTKYNSENLLMYKKYVLNDTWKFTRINELYQKYLGGVLPFENLVKENTKTVFNEKLVYKSLTNYQDGISLEVNNSYMIPAVKSGIVVFIGDKENYSNTIIIQGVDGVDTWYGNVASTSLKLYDYVESGTLIGETKENKLYLVFQKEGNYLSYETYLE